MKKGFHGYLLYKGISKLEDESMVHGNFLSVHINAVKFKPDWVCVTGVA